MTPQEEQAKLALEQKTKADAEAAAKAAADAKAKGKGQKVELEAETYQALLDRLDELEDAGKKGSKFKALADEARPASGKQAEPIDLDSVTQTELAHHIVSDLSRQVVHPLLVEIQSLKLEREIDRLDPEHSKIFSEMQDRVFELAGENPKLSIKQACDLAVKEAKKAGEEGATEESIKDKAARLKHLPKVPVSERPGAAG